MQMQQIRLLQASVDAEDDSELRVLLNGKDIKYLTVESGVYKAEDMCFEPALISILPPLPDGNWTCGIISHDRTSGQPSFTSLTTVNLPSITHTWHIHFIDYLELSIGRKLRSNVYDAFDPMLNRSVVLKFARFAWEIPQLDAETQAYSWIVGRNVSPEFLGHVKENGRVIGFIMEKMEDVRHAGPEDFLICRKVLSQLHDLRIKHGDINKHNFLVGRDRAVLIDFDQSECCADENRLVSESELLSKELNDLSGRGGCTQG